MTTGSLRWWFENRQTGDITIAQFPNWPLWSIAVASLVRFTLTDDSTAHDVAGWAIHGLWLFWGADEIVRGVNPWRRLLGGAVIVWQFISIVATIS